MRTKNLIARGGFFSSVERGSTFITEYKWWSIAVKLLNTKRLYLQFIVIKYTLVSYRYR